MSQTEADCHRLGLGEPVAMSCTTGEGMVDLYVALQPHVDALSLSLLRGQGRGRGQGEAASVEGLGPSSIPGVDVDSQGASPSAPSGQAYGRQAQGRGRGSPAALDATATEMMTMKVAIMGVPNAVRGGPSWGCLVR